MDAMKLQSMELFSCAGGMGEGFRRAGIEHRYVYDFDVNACDSYEKNLGHRPFQMDVRDLLRMCKDGWRPSRPLDFLVADPPCTPWSRVGKRKGTEDERDMLLETVALIRELKPRAYLIGNVPGLDDETNWHVVQEAIGGLSEIGYCTADFISLNAANYGVPQCRIRPFWFGHMGGACIQWPAPTHYDVRAGLQLPGISSQKPWVTCRDALAHLPLEKLGRPVKLKWKAGSAHKPSEADRPAATITQNTHFDGVVLVTGRARNKHPMSKLDAPAKTIAARQRGAQCGTSISLDSTNERFRRPSRVDEPARVVTAAEGTTGNKLLEWPWSRPATTIQEDDRIGPPGHHAESYRSAPGAVVLSELAATILQGFPESWHFAGKTKKAIWAQIGMAMPPPLAHAVATSVRRWFERNLAKQNGRAQGANPP